MPDVPAPGVSDGQVFDQAADWMAQPEVPPAVVRQFGNPWGLHIPPYRAIEHRGWRIRTVLLAAEIGYWGNPLPMRPISQLTGPGGGAGTDTWMSTSAFEIESQLVGLMAVRGTCVVFGFGMGWITVNTALKPEVDRVIVVERDPEVLALADLSGVFDGLSSEMRDKIELVEADALSWRPAGPVTTLQADIWPNMYEHSVLADVRRMQANVGAEQVYFWGQEAEFVRQAMAHHGGDADLDWPMIREIVAGPIGLPLTLPDWPDYPKAIMSGVRHFAPHLLRAGPV